MFAAAQEDVSNVSVMLDTTSDLFFGGVILVVEYLLKFVKNHHNNFACFVCELLRRLKHLDQIGL